MAQETEIWLTPADVAARIGINESTLRKWRAREDGPPYRKLNRSGRASKVRYPLDQFNEWMKSQTLVMPRSTAA